MGDSRRPASSSERINDLLERAPVEAEDWLDRARQLKKESGRPVFADLLRTLVHLRLNESEAESLWPRLLDHRSRMSAKAGRDVGLRIAVFDWFVNIDSRFREPMLIERARLERTEKSAMTDWLTGLYNRGAFRSAALRELRRAQRYRQMLSLALLDLDEFKKVNDTYGHERGDAVLREISRLLRRLVRDVDVAARYGGEEFAVLLPETGREGARAVAERIRDAVARQVEVGGHEGGEGGLTLSGGIAVYPEDGDELGELLRQADTALYRAKAAGKNMIVAEPEEKRLARRITLNGMRMLVSIERSGKEHVLRASATDISRTGIGLIVDEQVGLGKHVVLSLADPALGEKHPLTGRVVRHEEILDSRGSTSFEVGVALDEESHPVAAATIEAIFSAGRTTPRPPPRSAAP